MDKQVQENILHRMKNKKQQITYHKIKRLLKRELKDHNLCFNQELLTMVSGQATKEMDLELWYGLMVLDMKEIGNRTKLREMENSIMQMGMCLKVTGKTIRLMDMELIIMQMVINFKGLGRMMCSMVKAKRFGLTDQNLKVLIRMV